VTAPARLAMVHTLYRAAYASRKHGETAGAWVARLRVTTQHLVAAGTLDESTVERVAFAIWRHYDPAIDRAGRVEPAEANNVCP
jgi:hypothetical protein